MVTKALCVIFIVALVVGVLGYVYTDELAVFSRNNAARRGVTFVCHHLYQGTVTKEELCSVPVTEIPNFENRYKSILKKDGEWYQSHGLSYYPVITCDDSGMLLSFMEKKFRCDEGSAEILESSL